MDLMVNPVITDFQQDVNGDIKMLKLGANKEDAWQNIAEQGSSAKLDNNKAATIDVSTYTEPVVITPTSGKDGMKKATVTLSNIPSGVGTLYAWCFETSTEYCYTTTPTPTTSDKALQIKVEYSSQFDWFTIGSVTEEGITIGAGENVYARASTDDISLT